jgi:hypothetical protein
VDANGKPLHSWRTLILPYADQKVLYDRIDLSRPWDDPVNADVFKTRLPLYRCPSHLDPDDKTTYLAVVTPNSILRPESSIRLLDIVDGTSNTILVMEVDDEHAVPWMAPQDADAAWLRGIGAKTKFSHSGSGHALLADGAVRFLSSNLDPSVRQALITVEGGEIIGDY